MPTIAESFGQGYDVGRGIGNDFSSWRYQRNEAKLRQKYADDAKAAGMSLDEYLSQTPDGSKQARIAQLQDELHQLYQTSGAQKRGVTDRFGRRLDDVSIGNYDDQIAQGTNRRAATQALGGDIGGAQHTQAVGAAARGDYQHAIDYNRSADTIGAAKAAINPDGTVNQSGLADATNKIGGIAAKYGDTEGAAAGIETSRKIRYDLIGHLSGVAATMAQNPDKYTPEQISGAFSAVLQNVPELGGGLAVTYDKANKQFALMRGEEHVGNFDLQKDALPMLASLQKDPGSVVSEQVDLLKSVHAQRTKSDDELRAKLYDAKIEVGKKLADMPKTADAVSSYGDASRQLLQDGYTTSGDPNNGTVLLTPKAGGSPLIMRIGQPGTNPKTGVQTSGIEIVDAAGNPVDPSTFSGSAGIGAMQQALLKVRAAQSEAATAEQLERTKAAFHIFDAIGAQAGLSEFSGQSSDASGGARNVRNNNPGNIKAAPWVKSLPGFKGVDDKGFAIFDSADNGRAAQIALLQRPLYTKNPTVAGIVSKWSPEGDPGNAPGSTANYVKFVAGKLGVDPNAPLNLLDPKVAGAVADAMAQFEGGTAGPSAPAVAQQDTAAPAQPQAIPTKPAAKPAPFASQQTQPKPLLAMRDQLLAVDARAKQIRQTLAQFDREHPDAQTGFIQNAAGRMRNRLVQDLQEAEDQRDQLTAVVSRGANALREQTRHTLEERQYHELAQRYGTQDHATTQLASSLEKWGSGAGGSN